MRQSRVGDPCQRSEIEGCVVKPDLAARGFIRPEPVLPISMVSCPSCGTFNEAGNQFCGSCGRPLTIAPLQPPQVSHRRRNGLVVAVIIIVFLIAIVALLTVPVTHSFTGTVQSSYCSSCSSNPSKYVGFVSETIPSGSVSVQWQDASGDYVAFSVLQVGNFNTNQNCVED